MIFKDDFQRVEGVSRRSPNLKTSPMGRFAKSLRGLPLPENLLQKKVITLDSGVITMSKNKKYQQKDYLIKEYISKKKSALKIAKENNVDGNTILNWLRKYSIPIRSVSEQSSLRNNNRFKLTQEQLEIFEGELLGDGCLTKSFTNPRFDVTSKEIVHLNHLIKIFPKGFFRITKQNVSGCYSVYTPHLKDLLSFHYRYYQDGRKDLPNDFKLTPLKLKYWYYGDGHLVNKKTPIICSLLFNKKKLKKILLPQLEKLGIKANLQKNRIYVKKESAERFFEIVGEPISCYKYKWEMIG